MTIQELEQQIKRINDTLSKLVTLLTPEVKPCSYTLFSWLDEWLETYKRPKLQKGSITEIEICIRLHIKPYIADKSLNEITGLEIQKILNSIETSRTRKYTYNVLNGAMKQAYRLQLISNNIMLTIDPITHKYENGKALTKQEQENFYRIIENNPFRYIYEFYLLSGCRRSEATSLTWSDVDFKNKRIHIRGTKTKSSDRYIPLFPETEKLLHELPKISDTVFNTTWNAVSCNFKRLKQTYHFDFRLHDLRHTFASNCYQNGISMKTIQKWLGHSRLDTTANIYTHIQSAFELEEIAKFKSRI